MIKSNIYTCVAVRSFFFVTAGNFKIEKAAHQKSIAISCFFGVSAVVIILLISC